MKIFQMITLSNYGGAQAVVAQLCYELDKEHEVFLVYSGNGEAFRHLPPSVKQLRLGKACREVCIKDLLIFLKILYYRIRYRPEIVHLHSSKMGILGRIAFPRKKTVYTVHGFDSIRVAYRKFLFLEKLLSRKTGHIVGVSHYDMQGMKQEKIQGSMSMVYNGIQSLSGTFFDDGTDIVSHKLCRIKQDYAKVVMCIARLSPPKNFDLFLDIASQIPECAFVWIGNESQVENLPKNVFCLGSVCHARKYLLYSDVFILPSDFEGLPVSIIEAMSLARPVLASRVGGIPELITNGVNGFSLENRPEIFVAHLNILLKDSQKYDLMSENAQKSYLSNFTAIRMTNQYVSIYKELKKRKL